MSESALEHIGRLAVEVVLANRRLKEQGVCELDLEEDEDTGRLYQPNCRTAPRSSGERGEAREPTEWCQSCVAALALVTARRKARNNLSAAISRFLKRKVALPGDVETFHMKRSRKPIQTDSPGVFPGQEVPRKETK
jgi:hypothetical protein